MKVYTKTGDNGTTSLIGGARVSKDDIRVEAYGTVDELSSFIGLLSDKLKSKSQMSEYVDELYRINSILMNVEAHLAAGEDIGVNLPEVSQKSIDLLEVSIDKMQSQVPAITNFTIPGGDEIISLCHICRSICRRAERRSISVAEQFDVNIMVVKYLNRLSDYLYLLGRLSAVKLNVDEILWQP